jgi:hypothetical protein
MKDKELTDHSINKVALRFLKIQTVPKKLHEALQTILTKGKNNRNSNEYRKEIIGEANSLPNYKSYKVKEGREKAIYNILCLLMLYNTATIKKVLYQYYEHKNGKKGIDFERLLTLTKAQYFQYYCLGVESVNIKQLIGYLERPDFNLFEEALPQSILGTLNSNGLTLLPLLFDEDTIDWQEYMNEYKEAEKNFLENNFVVAKEILASLLSKPLKVPIAESLSAKILAEERENKEAWNYFNKLLN